MMTSEKSYGVPKKPNGREQQKEMDEIEVNKTK